MGTQEDQLLNKIMEHFDKKLEGTNNLIRAETEKIKSDTEEIDKNMKKNLVVITKDIIEIKKNVAANQEKAEANARRIDQSERKRNLIIFGLDQAENENPSALEEKIIDLIRNKLQVQIESFEIDFVKRFGK